jgi:hypothetical protein
VDVYESVSLFSLVTKSVPASSVLLFGALVGACSTCVATAITAVAVACDSVRRTCILYAIMGAFGERKVWFNEREEKIATFICSQSLVPCAYSYHNVFVWPTQS